jgi:hypothetical protein
MFLIYSSIKKESERNNSTGSVLSLANLLALYYELSNHWLVLHSEVLLSDAFIKDFMHNVMASDNFFTLNLIKKGHMKLLQIIY